MSELPPITHAELQRLGRLFLTADAADLRTWEDQHIHEWLNAQITVAWRRENATAISMTAEVRRAQAARCSCHGTDDMCPCQNVPDETTCCARLATSDRAAASEGGPASWRVSERS